ncbi:MAG: HPP family protein [Granulosicoccaceae bacterium]|jgi:CBS-domain-containing membrane protein
MLLKVLSTYFDKMRGGKLSPPRAPLSEVFWSGLGCFCGIFAVYVIGHMQDLHLQERLFLVGSFGASAVMIYGIPNSPYAQPRNVVVGHLVSAVSGVSCVLLLPSNIALAAALAVSLAVMLMHMTRSIHPPGGATALIAVVGGSNIHGLGYWYVISPIGLGALLMLLVALLVNNLSPYRRYPQYWY